MTNKSKITAVMRMIRFPNLVIIILTQYLVRVVFLKYNDFEGVNLALDYSEFVKLVISTLLISIAGYLINDYYDVEIDKINRPARVAVGTFISGRMTLFIAGLFALSGIVLGYWVASAIGSPVLATIHAFIVYALWRYSVSYKKQYLTGNLLIAILTVFVILVIFVFEMVATKNSGGSVQSIDTLYLLIGGYSVFAFFTTLIREIIKDIEDLKGDNHLNCNTLPSVSGVKTTTIVLISLTILTMFILGYWQTILLRFNLTQLSQYFIFVQILFGLSIPLYFLSKVKRRYFYLSQALKIIMVAGICSMFLI